MGGGVRRTVRAPSEATKRSTSATLSVEEPRSESEPGRLVEQVGRGARGAAGGPAGDGMARNEAGDLDCRERTLGRGDVGDDAAVTRGVQTSRTTAGSEPTGTATTTSSASPTASASDCAGSIAPRAAERWSTPESGVEAAGAGAGAAGGEGDGGTDEAGAYDCEASTALALRCLGRRRGAALGRGPPASARRAPRRRSR